MKAKKQLPKVVTTITFLLSKVSENFPIGHCDRAPEIATKKVTIDISRIVKFIEAAYTANRENNADWLLHTIGCCIQRMNYLPCSQERAASISL